MRKLAVALLALVFFALFSEGCLSFFLGRSWRELWHRPSFLESLGEPWVQVDADRFRAAAQTPGPYRVHEDPYVGYALKASAEVTYFDQRVRTDELGLRQRPGPPPSAGAFRILFLGDSVAFGHGLADEETIAAQVESLLCDARGPAAPEVACFTVAVPSWNYRNAVRFVLDHLDRLDPDLVLYLDVANDLDDSYGVNEAGQRRGLEDSAVPHPLLHVAPPMLAFRHAALRLLDRGERREVEQARLGPSVPEAGLSVSSSWRLDDMARCLCAFQERLVRVGARLVLLPYQQHAVHRQVLARLAQQNLEIPEIRLLEKLEESDTQGRDPHPSAATVRAYAIWTAGALLELGYVPGELRQALPEVEAHYAGRRARALTREELFEWARTTPHAIEAELEHEISYDSLRGLRQVYGGLNGDGTLGIELAALLPRGRALRVALAPLETRPDLYPLAVRVYVDEELAGSVELTSASTGPVVATFELPRRAGERPFEVRLEALDWCIAPVLDQSQPVSARVVSLVSLE